MSIIRILPEAVANKIAAGEVVERPASVVKELLENSLDAGADRVDVYVEAGGKRLIRVEDDGCGMDRDDAIAAFERHATSKIHSADDLFEITTLGFRGEALPSIASVSRLLLETRHASESAGIQVEIAGGRLRDVKEIARSGGTRLEVRDLFYNTPARRRFLKSESTELAHIASHVTHYALAYPEKSFRLTSLTHEILNASPVATLRERLYQVMGSQILEQLIEISPVERAMPLEAAPEEAEGGEPPEPAKVRLFGFVSRPEVQKLNRNQIYFFVNRRLVRDRVILHAITEAYRNILPSGMFPVALIFLEIPAHDVDVNVHPSKVEVRFRHSNFVHEFTRDAIRGALVASRPMAAFPMRRQATRERFQPADAIEIEAMERIDRDSPPGHDLGIRPRSPSPADRSSLSQKAQSEAGFALSAPQPLPQSGMLPLETPLPATPSVNSDSTAFRQPVPFGEVAVAPALGRELSGGSCGPGVELPAEEPRSGIEGLPPSGSAGEFPRNLRPLGQVHESFIVAANDEGLWIIDQHVAHERVLFEHHLSMRLEKRVEGQRLLLPIIVELKPEQQAVFQEIAQELGSNGFEVEPFGQRTIAIKAAPAEIRPEDSQKLLVEILDHVRSEVRSLTLDDLRRKIAASVACHAAIKVNMPLDSRKMEWLLRELGKTECPMSCPHGRPILLRYSLRDIQRAFKRI
jgi:DNA mismatch repair protein MutL